MSEGNPIQPAQVPAGRPAHVVLCHLPPEKTALILRNFLTLGPGYETILAYGGKEENFSRIDFKNKVYIPDPSLRRASHFISYFDVIAQSSAFMKSAGMNPEWIFLADFDLLPLKPNYLEEMIALMTSHGAGFGAKLIRETSLSNSLFLTHALNSGILRDFPLINGPDRKPVYHCLGAGLFFHHSCFEAATNFRNELGGMYFEHAVPTVAGLAGFRLLSFDRHGKFFEHVRYRPVFSCDEALGLVDEGRTFVHPVKEIEPFFTALEKKKTAAVSS